MSTISLTMICSKFMDCNSAPRTRRFAQARLAGIFFTVGLLALSCIALPKGFAQELGTLIDGPFYHEKSNSYFELYRLPGFEHRYNWEYARRAASRRVHSNVRGQLAVVDDADIHRFLVQKFDFPGETWIGLRYFCGPKRLLWINGKIHKLGEFAIWHPQWAGDPRSTCLNQTYEYMGAYYVGNGTYRWQLHGKKKAFPWFLVQYRMSD